MLITSNHKRINRLGLSTWAAVFELRTWTTVLATSHRVSPRLTWLAAQPLHKPGMKAFSPWSEGFSASLATRCSDAPYPIARGSAAASSDPLLDLFLESQVHPQGFVYAQHQRRGYRTKCSSYSLN